MTSNSKTIRVRPEERDKIVELSGKCKAIEKSEVPSSEVMRRMFRIPNIDKILEQDSLNRRKLKLQ